jgi:hypothetical protein
MKSWPFGYGELACWGLHMQRKYILDITVQLECNYNHIKSTTKGAALIFIKLRSSCLK